MILNHIILINSACGKKKKSLMFQILLVEKKKKSLMFQKPSWKMDKQQSSFLGILHGRL